MRWIFSEPLHSLHMEGARERAFPPHHKTRPPSSVLCSVTINKSFHLSWFLKLSNNGDYLREHHSSVQSNLEMLRESRLQEKWSQTKMNKRFEWIWTPHFGNSPSRTSVKTSPSMRNQEHQCALKISPQHPDTAHGFWGALGGPVTMIQLLQNLQCLTSYEKENEKCDRCSISLGTSQPPLPCNLEAMLLTNSGVLKSRENPPSPPSGPGEPWLGAAVLLRPPIWSWGFRTPYPRPPLLLPPYWSSAGFPGHQLAWGCTRPQTVLGQSSGSPGPCGWRACSLGVSGPRLRRRSMPQQGPSLYLWWFWTLVTVRADWGGKTGSRASQRDELNSRSEGLNDFPGLWGDRASPSLHTFTSYHPWLLCPWCSSSQGEDCKKIWQQIHNFSYQKHSSPRAAGRLWASPVGNEQIRGALAFAKAAQHAPSLERHCLGVKGTHTSHGRRGVCVFNQFLHICLYTVGLLHKSHPNYLNICRAKLKLLYQSCIFSFTIFGVIFHPCVSLFQ